MKFEKQIVDKVLGTNVILKAGVMKHFPVRKIAFFQWSPFLKWTEKCRKHFKEFSCLFYVSFGCLFYSRRYPCLINEQFLALFQNLAAVHLLCDIRDVYNMFTVNSSTENSRVQIKSINSQSEWIEAQKCVSCGGFLILLPKDICL